MFGLRQKRSLDGAAERPSRLPASDLPLKPDAQPANANDVSEQTPQNGWLNDGAIVRTIFFGLLGFVGATLFLDYRTLQEEQAAFAPPTTTANPVLPAAPAVDSVPGAGDGETRVAPAVVTDRELLASPMTMELKPGGVFELTGSIVPGSASAFIEEIEGKSEYIRTVRVDSPGGSVTDALSIAARIREEGWNTEVLDGALCASSCPLVFSGGVERSAGQKAAIGVHQMFTGQEDNRSTSQAISGTQNMTARISRHLSDMGVDPSMWVHAMETPPRSLYYFSNDELTDYQLATKLGDAS